MHLLLTSLINGCVCFWCSVSLPAPGILQETMVPVVANDQCNTLLGSGSVTTNMMCAGLIEGGKDTCQVQQPSRLSTSKHAAYLKVH